MKSASLFIMVCVVAGMVACGGGGSAPPPPPPAHLTVTSNVAAGQVGVIYQQQLHASGGAPPYKFSSGTLLPLGLTMDKNGAISGIPAAAGAAHFTVNVTDSGTGTGTGTVHLNVTAAPFAITTTSLPDAVVNHFYEVQLATLGTAGPGFWTLSGSLPTGMGFSALGIVTGTPTVTGSFSFTVSVPDSVGTIATQALTLNVVSSAARNDDIAHATPITRGKFTASLSPGFDAGTGLLTPADSDFYAVNTVGGATYTIESFADRLIPTPSQMDTVIELVDSNGQRLQTCDDPALDAATAPLVPPKLVGGFFDQCINDDVQIGGSTRDSRILLRVPGALEAPSTFFVHVFEFRGMARPDFIYQLSVDGSN